MSERAIEQSGERARERDREREHERARERERMKERERERDASGKRGGWLLAGIPTFSERERERARARARERSEQKKEKEREKEKRERERKREWNTDSTRRVVGCRLGQLFFVERKKKIFLLRGKAHRRKREKM